MTSSEPTRKSRDILSESSERIIRNRNNFNKFKIKTEEITIIICLNFESLLNNDSRIQSEITFSSEISNDVSPKLTYSINK